MEERVCANCFRPLGPGNFCAYCGYDNSINIAEDAAPLRRFSRLRGNRYIIGRVLGIGGFGITYVAQDTFAMDRRIAIKEYYPSGIARRDIWTQQISFGNYGNEYNIGLRRFEREANMLAMLRGGRAASVVQVYEFFYENGTGYMVMEYIEGHSLKELARARGGRIPYDEAYYILKELLKALETVHSEGVLHRDISPENIIIQPDGRLRLIDFGAARTAQSTGLTGNMIMLKPGFAPPEQYDAAGNQGPWTDIYALACTFYRLVSGVRVPDARERIQGQRVPLLHLLMPETVPEEVSNAIEKAMTLDPGGRYRSMSEFMEAIGTPDAPEGNEREGLIDRVKWIFKSVAKVTVLETGKTKSLKRDDVITVGRSEGCDLITMDNAYIGRVHCRIYFDADVQAVKVECTSINGIQTREGRTVNKGEAMMLYDEETTLRLANTESKIRVVYQ